MTVITIQDQSYIAQDLEKGDTLTPENLRRIRPGHGLAPKYYDLLLGKKVNQPEAQLYIYQYNDLIYPTMVASSENRLWLVMFSMDGIIETAFPPDNPTSYLDQLSFKYLGLLKELTS